jgi:uncharacterized protein YuzE
MNRSNTHYRRCAAVRNSVGKGRLGYPYKSCKGNALAGALAGLLLVASAFVSSGQAPSTTMRGSINGTIAKIDAPALYLRMQSDTGQHLRLAVANVDAMRAVRAGDHVRIDIDENGIALNINKTTVTPRPTSYSRG